MIDHAQSSHQQGIDAVRTRESIGNTVIAGSGTVASTLAAVYHHLWGFGAYQDLVKVLHGTFSRQTEIAMDATSKSSFLNATLSEAMKRYLSLLMVLPQTVPGPGQ